MQSVQASGVTSQNASPSRKGSECSLNIIIQEAVDDRV